MTAGLYDKELWALTPHANEARSLLIEAGLDADLALSVLEASWPEWEIYQLDEEASND